MGSDLNHYGQYYTGNHLQVKTHHRIKRIETKLYLKPRSVVKET